QCVNDPGGTSAKVCQAIPPQCTPGSAFGGGTVRSNCTAGDTPPMVLGNSGNPVGPATAPGSCQKPVQCAALPAAQMLTLGTRTAGDTVTFNVPASTA